MTTGKGIQINEFGLIVSDKKLKGSGLRRGDVVYVAALKPAPMSRKDPYVQRIFALVLKAVNGVPLVPKDDNDYRAYMIDPNNLEILPDEEQLVLTENMHKNYGKTHESTD